MTKTIEEYAEEFADAMVKGALGTRNDYYDSYIKGAIDQRKRDIEKAWKWIEWMLGTQSATPDFVEESHNRFKKAMEEE